MRTLKQQGPHRAVGGAYLHLEGGPDLGTEQGPRGGIDRENGMVGLNHQRRGLIGKPQDAEVPSSATRSVPFKGVQ